MAPAVTAMAAMPAGTTCSNTQTEGQPKLSTGADLRAGVGDGGVDSTGMVSGSLANGSKC
jgi:hypothetical protein